MMASRMPSSRMILDQQGAGELPAEGAKRGCAAAKISFVSLGCPKALVDSEQILSRLRAEGYELTRTHEGAAAVIINTCGFLDSAKAEFARGDRRGGGGKQQDHRHGMHGRRARTQFDPDFRICFA